MESKRNYTLDFIKLIASFFVVFIHVPFYGIVGDVIKLLARAAVPIFFMTSGFFCYGNDLKTILRKIKKIFLILVFTSFLYNFTNIIIKFVSDGTGGVIEYFIGFGDIQKWLLLLVFNLPFSAIRLWFLFALIYVYFLHMLFIRCKISYKSIFTLSIFALAVHIFIGSGLPLLGFEVEDYICRNFLLFGYPFFGMGLIFRHYAKRIAEIPDIVLAMCSIAGCLLSLLPMLYSSASQISIGTVLLVFAIFSFSLRKDSIRYPVSVRKLCECSLGIYIFHRPVATITGRVLAFVNLTEYPIFYGFAFPILVCFFSALLTLILINFQNKKRKI